MNFVFIFKVDKFHSVLHLLLNMVPSSMDMLGTKGSSATSTDKDGSRPSDDSKDGNEEDISEIILPSNDGML